MQTAKIYKKVTIQIEALFSRFKGLFKKVAQDTDQKPKRSYLDDMAIPRANFRSQIGNYHPTWADGRNFLMLLIGMLLMFQGCRTQQVPVESKTEVRIVDSVVLKDSVVIIPTERIVDIVPWYDTLHLESTVAWSDAWIDTNYHIIQGQLVNKQGMLVEVRYVDRWKVRDSIVEKEKPVYITETVENVKRPWWSWVCLTWTVVTLCSIAFVVYKKIKGLV